MDRYMKLGAVGADRGPAFTADWIELRVDGASASHQAIDPFGAKVARLERIGLVVGNDRNRLRGQWHAIDAAGNILGIYDAYLLRSKDHARIITLSIYTDGTSARPQPLMPFCDSVGDIEKWHEAKAEREANKAAKQAARVSPR
jgi:hypothetical protein